MLVQFVNEELLKRLRLKLDKNDFSRCVFLPSAFEKFFSSKKPYQISYGSRYSAKTRTKGMRFLLQARKPEHFRLVFSRNTQKNAKDSQYQLFKDLLDHYSILKSEFNFNKHEMTITHKNGNFLKGGSFEKPESLLSSPNITDFWAEEPITHEGSITRKSFLSIAGTLRNESGIVPRMHLTFNPISQDTWIYEDFFKNKLYGDEVDILRVNYQDNPFCPQDRIDYLNRLKLIDHEKWLVDGLGEWGIIKADNPFFFNADKINIRPVKWRDDVLTIFAFDFNLDIMSCGVIQFNPQTKVIAVLAEFEPCTGVEQRIRTIRASKYFNPNKPYMYEITGDFDGVKRGRVDGQITSYNQIEEGLGMQPIQTKISPNISHYDSRHLCANIFSTWTVYIDPSCTRLIADLKATPTTKDGKIDKRKYDPHYADFLRYFIQNYCK